MKIENFWARVLQGSESECWNWAGTVGKNGYGRFTSGFYAGMSSLAHRIAHTLSKGPIPEGLSVLHKCDNKLCCNPDHLWAGTNAENNADAREKGRSRSPEGEDHWAHKISAADAKNIYSDQRLYKEIAIEYGIAETNICNIKAGRAWRSIHAS